MEKLQQKIQRLDLHRAARARKYNPKNTKTSCKGLEYIRSLYFSVLHELEIAKSGTDDNIIIASSEELIKMINNMLKDLSELYVSQYGSCDKDLSHIFIVCKKHYIKISDQSKLATLEMHINSMFSFLLDNEKHFDVVLKLENNALVCSLKIHYK